MFELGLSKLASMPTVLNNMHESLFRSYHALRMIKELLAKGTPGDVVLAIISEVDNLQPLQTELVANKACTGRGSALCPHGRPYDELCEPCGRVPDPSPRQ